MEKKNQWGIIHQVLWRLYSNLCHREWLRESKGKDSIGYSRPSRKKCYHHLTLGNPMPCQNGTENHIFHSCGTNRIPAYLTEGAHHHTNYPTTHSIRYLLPHHWNSLWFFHCPLQNLQHQSGSNSSSILWDHLRTRRQKICNGLHNCCWHYETFCAMVEVFWSGVIDQPNADR